MYLHSLSGLIECTRVKELEHKIFRRTEDVILKSYVSVEKKIFTVNFLYDQRLKSVNFTPND